jgi:hypothetical protein
MLKDGKKEYNSTKLVTTLTSMVTKLKKSAKTKTTYISVKELDF